MESIYYISRLKMNKYKIVLNKNIYSQIDPHNKIIENINFRKFKK